jgi:hypothetical protein
LENEVKMLQEAVRAVALLPQLVETLQNCSPEYKTVDGSYCIFCDADMNYGVHADNCKYVRLTKEGTK